MVCVQGRDRPVSGPGSLARNRVGLVGRGADTPLLGGRRFRARRRRPGAEIELRYPFREQRAVQKPPGQRCGGGARLF